MDKEKTKKVKKKGPLRTEAIVPIFLVIIIFGVYFRFYFDSHLRRGLQYGATQVHGAEVNIASLRTDFLAPAIYIGKIQVTNKTKPSHNLIQVGQVRLSLLWDGLLRGKFVIPEASVLEIQADAERKKPGYVLPPPKNKKAGKSQVELAADKTIDQLKQKNESNLLGDVFAVAGGANYKDQLKKMESQLKSQQVLQSLEADLKNKEVEWKKKLNDLPDESEIKQLVKQIEGLKIDTSSPQKIQASLKKVDSLYKEARNKYKTIESAKKAFDADIKKYESEYKSLEKSIQDDINGLATKLNIPSLDPKEINKMLLGNLVAQQLGSLMKYKNIAREYMPAKTSKERKAEKKSQELTPVERANGVNFSYPKNKSYPLFWLQTAKISSDSKAGMAGDLEGTLKNVTDNPRHLGKPTTFDFKGGFPHQQIADIVGNITIDHTTEHPIEKGRLSVGSFPVKGNTLTKSKDVEMGFQDTTGASKISFLLKDETVQLASNSLFSNVNFVNKAADKNVKRLLDGVTASLKKLDLNIKAKGSWDDLSLNINSNLGQKLANAIKQQISAEITKARKQVENHVKQVVGKGKGELKQQVAKLEQALGVSLKSRTDAINSVKSTVEKKKKEAKKKEVKKIEKKLKNEAKKLLKGIKF